MLELFLTFAKIGLFTLGGGYAMIGVIEDACVTRKQWITHPEMMELVVIAESTPGPIAINCATYVGYRRRGFAGAVAATVGMVLPSFVIIYLISLFLHNVLEFPVIANAFRGIKVGVGVVIINAGWKLMKKTPKERLSRNLLLMGLWGMLLIHLFSLEISALAVMLTAGVISLAVAMGKGGMQK